MFDSRAQECCALLMFRTQVTELLLRLHYASSVAFWRSLDLIVKELVEKGIQLLEQNFSFFQPFPKCFCFLIHVTGKGI